MSAKEKQNDWRLVVSSVIQALVRNLFQNFKYWCHIFGESLGIFL